MANVFGILTAIVLALAAYVANQNKKAYTDEITSTTTQKDLLRTNKAKLAAAQEILKALPIERGGVEDENLKLSSERETLTKSNDELKAEAETKTAKIASNKAKLDEIREKTKKTGDLKELASKMNTTNSDLERLSQSITGCETKLANLTAQSAQTDAQIKASKEKFENYSKGQSLPSLKTSIRSIYSNWGFVTLAGGNNVGVMNNSTLDVVRDGTTIAKLLVTAVESNSSSASIVPDSVSQDVTLMVGDKVVPSQKAAAKTSVAASNN